MKDTKPISTSTFRENLAISLMTGVGLLLRVWPPGRLGLTHFDEGIYCFAGLWALSPGGLSGLDPMLISYAPPGYPILVGIVYWLLGPSDSSAIMISQLMGTATIPLVAWLARRIFGPGAGLAAAILTALSGPHIAFSRMALTDASFLLAWLIALAAGIRFLERPGPARAIGLGVAVGLAQQFKYNGWLTGGVVIATAVVGLVMPGDARRFRAFVKTLAWGALAAGVAFNVVLPWFLFVQNHGGYSALLRHQQSYLGGVGRWLWALRSQEAQTISLSGSKPVLLFTWFFAAVGTRWLQVSSKANPHGEPRNREAQIIIVVLVASLLVVVPDSAWWLGLASLPWLIASRFIATRVLGVWWSVLSLMTPLYHPYARLWLPIHAAEWIIGAGLLSQAIVWLHSFSIQLFGLKNLREFKRGRTGLAFAWLITVGLLCINMKMASPGRAQSIPGLLSPSDSLRHAAGRVVSRVPGEVLTLRFIGRPSLRFYLAASRIKVLPQSNVAAFFSESDRQAWALLDEAVVVAEGSSTSRSKWELVESFPTDLALPTLLDIKPDAGLRGPGDVSSRTVHLRLYRPRSASLP